MHVSHIMHMHYLLSCALMILVILSFERWHSVVLHPGSGPLFLFPRFLILFLFFFFTLSLLFAYCSFLKTLSTCSFFFFIEAIYKQKITNDNQHPQVKMHWMEVCALASLVFFLFAFRYFLRSSLQYKSSGHAFLRIDVAIPRMFMSLHCGG